MPYYKEVKDANDKDTSAKFSHQAAGIGLITEEINLGNQQNKYSLCPIGIVKVEFLSRIYML